MIIHICDRCGYREQFPKLKSLKTKEDPHGQHGAPGGALCDFCEELEVELKRALEAFASECLADFRVRNIMHIPRELIEIYNKERPVGKFDHCPDSTTFQGIPIPDNAIFKDDVVST